MTQILNSKQYDLEERTACFAESIILLCKNTQRSVVSLPIIVQLLRSATSVGANYAEANGASSRKDFKNKIDISCKEAKETRYWLRLLASVDGSLKEKCRMNWKEANELVLIFGKISGSTKQLKH